MKRLSKAESARKTELAEQLAEKIEGLEAAVTEFNERRQDDFDRTVAKALGEVNKAIAEAREFAEGVWDRQTDFYGERSEKWQEGDRGVAYLDWQDAWEAVAHGMDEASMDDPQEVEMPDLPDAQGLDDLDDEPPG